VHEEGEDERQEPQEAVGQARGKKTRLDQSSDQIRGRKTGQLTIARRARPRRRIEPFVLCADG
jgi:hypothetical protein